MSATAKAWFVAASIAAVEALKDQGVCRWNYTIRALQQHLKNRIKSAAQNKKVHPQSSVAVSRLGRGRKVDETEETMRTVMFLSCWGPYD